MRLLKPEAPLNPQWCEEDLNTQTVRTLNMMHSFGAERNVYTMMTYTRKRPFTASAFAYCLPFLKRVLRDRGSLVKNDEGLRMKALQVIMLHSKLRSSPSIVMETGFDEVSKKLLCWLLARDKIY